MLTASNKHKLSDLTICDVKHIRTDLLNDLILDTINNITFEYRRPPVCEFSSKYIVFLQQRGVAPSVSSLLKELREKYCIIDEKLSRIQDDNVRMKIILETTEENLKTKRYVNLRNTCQDVLKNGQVSNKPCRVTFCGGCSQGRTREQKRLHIARKKKRKQT